MHREPASQHSPVQARAQVTPVKALAGTQAESLKPIDYAREVLPILSNQCFHCHGPDQDSKEAKAAGFRLDKRKEAVDFEMIIPGKADKSPVIARVTTSNNKLRMPPLDSGKPQLTGEQVATLKRWIDQGAEYSEHWAFVKPQKPELPEVKDKAWPSNGIDYFVLAGLEKNGLEPNAPADRHRLIRRLYLDLIGLPPTPEQAEAFASDPSPDAYAKVVDELLSSPRYGEHWARQWLDKARYADSQGFAEDRPRTMWRYRDWVIQAYNRDMPFDRFTLEQIAGDLLPDPTMDQLIATGFHRNTMTNTEGGTDDEEFRVAAVIDRVNTTMEVWMGITMNCVQCHSHKYDPIYHDEYYQFFAFFNQSQDSDRHDDAPFIKAPLPDQPAELEKLRRQVDQATQALKQAGQQPFVLPKDKKAKPEVEPTPEQKRLLDAQKKFEDFNSRIPNALVMRDLPEDKRRETYVFKGGSFLSPDKEHGVVEPGVPAVFHKMPADAPRNRLGLAQWLVAQDNPLTSRVQVNRIWELIWGVGLVDTGVDFGFQGSYPHDKALLDWLAYTYQHDLAWSTKSLIRLIVTSSAYRQSALHTELKQEIDPYNRLMSRGPRVRLSAEQVRDQALTIAGILKLDRIGGPSVTPYLPDGVIGQSFSGVKQRESSGADLYRRGVYTYWQRGAHYASFAVFDAPSRDVCTSMRSRTNTPLQAFVTLNDRVYVEAAQMLARRIMAEAGSDPPARLKRGIALTLQRDATATELAALGKVYEQSLAGYRADPDSANAMAVGPAGPLPEGMDVAQAAAMTVVSNVLLNLDELINKP